MGHWWVRTWNKLRRLRYFTRKKGTNVHWNLVLINAWRKSIKSALITLTACISKKNSTNFPDDNNISEAKIITWKKHFFLRRRQLIAIELFKTNEMIVSSHGRFISYSNQSNDLQNHFISKVSLWNTTLRLKWVKTQLKMKDFYPLSNNDETLKNNVKLPKTNIDNKLIN